MLADGLVVAEKEGSYRLPANAPDANPDDLPDAPAAPDAASGVSPDAAKSRIGRPKHGEIFAYSVADGGMIPNAVLRERKGYRDVT